MQKTCAVSGKTFEITDQDLEFYKKMDVPPPTLCPSERQRRRLAWQNMYNIYHRTCDGTGKKMLSCFSPDKPFLVYEQSYWWSDAWNATDYGQDFDFDRPFFDQFQDLLHKTPLPSMFTNHLDDENSEFTNFAGYDKDCYLIFHADMNRECLYGTGVKKCTNVVDIFNVFDSELCYQCVDCRNGYNLKYCQDTENCRDSWFLKNCIGCHDCFGCTNLRQKSHYLFNRKVTPKEYEDFMKDFESGSHQNIEKLQQQFIEFQATQAHRATQGYQNENVSGDHIFRCQNVQNSFDVQESRDMKFCERIYNGPNSDCYDIDQFGMKIQKVCEAGPIGQDSVNVFGASMVYNSVDCHYLLYSFNCQDCFGCVGLKKAKYCILNKQYTKEVYFELKAQIIEHMKSTKEFGEFFPISMSPFGYNETIAQEYYPLTKDQALSKNYRWKELESNASYDGPKYKIPDHIDQVDESICDQVLTCDLTEKNYRIVKPEYAFYKKMGLPIPRICPDERHRQRTKLRNPRTLFDRPCAECQSPIQTTFSPERTEKVLCEACYSNIID